MVNDREIEKWRNRLRPYIMEVQMKLYKEEMQKKKKLRERVKC